VLDTGPIRHEFTLSAVEWATRYTLMTPTANHSPLTATWHSPSQLTANPPQSFTRRHSLFGIPYSFHHVS
jgi:hypothetical protein